MGDDNPSPPAAIPPPATPPAPVAPTQQPDPDQQAQINRRLYSSQGQQSTILGGSGVDTTQGVVKKDILGN